MDNKAKHEIEAGNSEGRITRRGILKSVLAGVIAAPLLRASPWLKKVKNWRLLRPPFARLREKEFLGLCIRCGMCIKVCKTNTLQPEYVKYGAENMMTPVLKPDIAACDPACTACGQVCPTNAILPFTAEDKLAMKQGTARLELSRCIGWTDNRDCNICVRECPTQAIKVTKEKGVDKPIRIVSGECIGCGLCEEACNGIVINNSACVLSNKGRGVPTNYAAIKKNIKEKEDGGKSFLPRAGA